MKKNSLAIMGASGHGKVLAEIAELNGYSPVFYDDNYLSIKQIHHWPVLGNLDTLIESRLPSIVGIGNNKIRKKVCLILESKNIELKTLVHPRACVSDYASLGKGTVVMANSVVNPFVAIGKSCIINTSSVIEHDCKISDYVHISPNVALAGKVKVGELTWIGLGSAIKQCVEIGDACIIGAGSIAINNIPNNSLGYGVPLKYKLRADN
jgi:sugar O-acyltransferase (sialic acid O-acetyltransferase NeuD family)